MNREIKKGKTKTIKGWAVDTMPKTYFSLGLLELFETKKQAKECFPDWKPHKIEIRFLT